MGRLGDDTDLGLDAVDSRLKHPDLCLPMEVTFRSVQVEEIFHTLAFSHIYFEVTKINETSHR